MTHTNINALCGARVPRGVPNHFHLLPNVHIAINAGFVQNMIDILSLVSSGS
jgi:hypothetical protein